MNKNNEPAAAVGRRLFPRNAATAAGPVAVRAGAVSVDAAEPFRVAEGPASVAALEKAFGRTHMTVETLGRELGARLALTRPLVCLDLEATGVRVEHDRIVQIAAAIIFADGCVTTWSSIVNPEQPIPPGATAVHGISDAMASSAPTFAELAPTIKTLLSGRDLAGYNVERFDRRMLAAEFRRAGLEDPTAGAHIVDAYTIFARQEPRSLEAALRFYGVPEQADRRAHEANSDVEATVAVLLAQLKAYDDLPTSVDDLHEWFYPTDPNRIDPEGKLVWREGLATVSFGAQAGISLADLAVNDRGFLEWMLRKDFSDEVKAIVREALAGRFPVHAETSPASDGTIRGTNSFPDDMRRFVDNERWTFAKTMPDWPHEYLVRARVDAQLFERLVTHIRCHGYKGHFYQKEITYYDESGLVYWTMGAPVEETIIINRCRKEASFEYRSRNGQLPD